MLDASPESRFFAHETCDIPLAQDTHNPPQSCAESEWGVVALPLPLRPIYGPFSKAKQSDAKRYAQRNETTWAHRARARNTQREDEDAIREVFEGCDER
jgi:hypothetical protein